MTKFLVERYGDGRMVTDEVEAEEVSVEVGMLVLTRKTSVAGKSTNGAIYSPGSWVSVRTKPVDET